MEGHHGAIVAGHAKSDGKQYDGFSQGHELGYEGDAIYDQKNGYQDGEDELTVPRMGVLLLGDEDADSGEKYELSANEVDDSSGAEGGDGGKKLFHVRTLGTASVATKRFVVATFILVHGQVSTLRELIEAHLGLVREEGDADS